LVKLEGSVIIGDRRIGESVFIIAEAGVNHNGSLKRAMRMVDEAALARADAVKFQAFVTDRLVSSEAPKAEYQSKSVVGRTQLNMLKPLELGPQDFAAIAERSRKRGIIMLSSAFDEESADVLEKLGVPAYKIGSGDLTNIPLLEHIAKKGKPVLLSTGMATLEEIQEALSAISAQGNNQIVILHCVSSYPSQPQDSNLRVMQVLRERFKVPVGFSDHSKGVEVALAAAALGAVVIEKHFTLSRRLPGPDQRTSLEPSEFRKLVQGVRVVEQALGKPVKEPTPEELKMRLVARRSLVASVSIQKGQVLSRQMVAIKRPGTGIPPKEIGKMIGKRATRNIRRDQVLRWEMVE
jgi:N,N'-diacetyllegionaminate synthase